MNSVRSGFGVLAVSAALGAFGCSHEQKAPPAHPAPPPVAERVTPPPQQPVAEAPSEAPADKDGPAIFFDFDSYTLRADARPVLQKVASSLKAAHATELEIDGNCDELGTTEYNMALGEERARAAKNYLIHLGVPNARVRTISYGSERPKYPGHDDDARAKNRRDDLVVR